MHTASTGIFINSHLQPYATGVNFITVCKGTSKYGSSSKNKYIDFTKNRNNRIEETYWLTYPESKPKCIVAQLDE